MNARETVAEIAYPVTRMTLLPPIIVSWLLFSLALAFGLYGMLLFAVTLVPFIRYLMRVLVARAHGHAESPFDAELMSLIGDGWELFPLVTAAAAAWGLYLLLQTAPYALVLALAAILCLVYPASLAVLSVTRSPLQSVNPLAVYRLIRATGFDYLVLVIVLGALAVALFELRNSGVASVFIGLGLVYFMFLMYSMTSRGR
jgi:hypothetical protein